MYDRFEQLTFRVNQNMPFPTPDIFSPAKPHSPPASVVLLVA